MDESHNMFTFKKFTEYNIPFDFFNVEFKNMEINLW